MRIYIYEGVLSDYTDGMVVTIAKSRAQADRIMDRWSSSSYSLEYWKCARARSFPLKDSVKNPGVVATVYGGG